MTELQPLPDEEDNFKPPPYGKPGRVLVEYWWGFDDFDILDYDADTSMFWLHEDGLFDYCLLDQLDLPAEGGGPVGRFIIWANARYIKGQTWRESPMPYDDDIEVNVDLVQRTNLDHLP